MFSSVRLFCFVCEIAERISNSCSELLAITVKMCGSLYSLDQRVAFQRKLCNVKVGPFNVFCLQEDRCSIIYDLMCCIDRDPEAYFCGNFVHPHNLSYVL